MKLDEKERWVTLECEFFMIWAAARRGIIALDLDLLMVPPA